MRDIEGIEKVLAVLEPYWAEIHADFDAHNRRFLQLAGANHDLIGRVLKAHLVIENFLNSFLSAHYGISDLADAKLTFYQKAKLLPDGASSTAFVKPGILQLNAVRNKFGHRLDFAVEPDQLSAIYEVLSIARSGSQFPSPVDAIEAFCPVACAFLSVPPPHLEKLFMEAFSHVRTRKIA
jgi:hypothetical protein